MAASFRVRLNLRLIQSNLETAGDPLTDVEIVNWLIEEGFREDGNGWWICEEITLDVLDPSEIVEAIPIA